MRAEQLVLAWRLRPCGPSLPRGAEPLADPSAAGVTEVPGRQTLGGFSDALRAITPARQWVKAGHKPGSVPAAFGQAQRRGGDHLSGTSVAAGLERRDKSGPGKWPTLVPRPCSQPGFTEPAPLDAAGALLPHPCTLACAPDEANLSRAIGGVFLWHCPHGRPHWALPSRPGHWGARTFLNRVTGLPKGNQAPDRDHLACFRHQLKRTAQWRPHQEPRVE